MGDFDGYLISFNEVPINILSVQLNTHSHTEHTRLFHSQSHAIHSWDDLIIST